MTEAGFDNVTELKYKWPIGTWPKDPKQKQLGKMTMVNMLSGLEGGIFAIPTSPSALIPSRLYIETLEWCVGDGVRTDCLGSGGCAKRYCKSQNPCVLANVFGIR